VIDTKAGGTLSCARWRKSPGRSSTRKGATTTSENAKDRPTGPVFRPTHFLRLCLLALMRLRYLCLDIFLRRFLTSEPMDKPL
jgi:hypothetical protein